MSSFTLGHMTVDDFTIDLVDSCPMRIRDLLVDGANILITPTDLFNSALDSDAIASVAVFNGLIMEDSANQRRSVTGTGPLGYLENDIAYASRPLFYHSDIPTLPATVDDFMDEWFSTTGIWTNGLVKGTGHNPTAAVVNQLDIDSYLPPVKGPLDRVMQMTGNEYRALPTCAVDWGRKGDLFNDSPTLLVAPGVRDRYSGDLVALTVTDFDAVRSIREYRDVGAAESETYQQPAWPAASDLGLKSFRDDTIEVHYGSEMVSIDFSDDEDDVGALATAIAERYADYRRTFTCTLDEYCLPRRTIPGDWIWVSAPNWRVQDLENLYRVGGQWVFPEKLRIAAMTCPIQPGMGVYVHNWDADPVLTRITPYVKTSREPTQLTIGDKPLPLVRPKFASLVD